MYDPKLIQRLKVVFWDAGDSDMTFYDLNDESQKRIEAGVKAILDAIHYEALHKIADPKVRSFFHALKEAQS